MEPRLPMSFSHLPAERHAAQIIKAWLDGGQPDAAGILEQYPDLAADKAIALDLAFAEYLVLQLRGEQVDAEAFCNRFPAYRASLTRMVAQQSIQPLGIDANGAVPEDLSNQTMHVPVTPVVTQQASDIATGSGSGPGVWPEVGNKIGDFNLLRQLGKGAFGRVFLALEETTTKHVVVKVTKQKCDEAKVLGRVGHGNVVSVLSAPHDVATGLYLVVMPFFGSSTFEDLLELAYPVVAATSQRPRRARVILEAARRNQQPNDPSPNLPPADSLLDRGSFLDGVVWLGVRVADALAAVHECGYVHHDLKPSNILLGLDGQPRLLDFNLASDAKNLKSRLGGTLPYMPPEHLDALRSTEAREPMPMKPSGDIFSLGVILYELLTGAHPFGRFPKSRSVRKVAEELLERQRGGMRSVRERTPNVSPRLSRLVDACLSFDPMQRPESARQVAAELRRCFTANRRARQFLTGRPGRAIVAASAIAVVGTGSWYASNQARATVKHSFRDDGLNDFASGKFTSAAPALAKAAEESPEDPEIWLALGRARVAGAEWRAATPALHRAVALRPGHGPTLATYAWTITVQGYSDQAIQALEQAESAGYKTAALYALKAAICNQKADAKGCDTAVEQALAIDPDNRTALLVRGMTSANRSMFNRKLVPIDALADLEKAAKIGTPSGEIYQFIARMYAWNAQRPDGDREANGIKAIRALRQAVEMGTGSSWRTDSTFRSLFGDPSRYSANWTIPTTPRIDHSHWAFGDPLADFAG